ncbi:MAG: energy-coupling factor transporter transmembrane protein EcfT [Proteobacteria bacterium]|nr:energy-coupling factor transporter transmembrane protein EcfT [Pseudomonadota bacterium]
MRASVHDIWGSGRGWIRRAAPTARLLCGILCFAACMMATGGTYSGAACTVGTCLLWLVACRPPRQLLLAIAVLGLALLLPYFLLLPILPNAPAHLSGDWSRALSLPTTILLRGLGGMLITAATASALTVTELREALLRLPVPGMVSAILLQIIHQSATLYYETRQMAAAMAVRGATSGGRAALRILVSLPRVWMPRIIARADRVGDAMELREYLTPLPAAPSSRTKRHIDLWALCAAIACLVTAIALRAAGVP